MFQNSSDTKTPSTRPITASAVGKAKIQTKLKIGQPNDVYEREADQVADSVVNGTEKTQGNTNQSPSARIQPKPLLNAPEHQIQRLAFVNGTQVNQTEEQPNTTMKAWANDNKIRDYKTRKEFEKHSNGSTDHLGILKTGSSLGTWVRFSETGLNILGEGHTMVTLMDVAPAVGSTDFVYEPFSTDDFSTSIATGHAYNVDNQERFETMGIGGVTDSRPYGLESTFPKIALTLMELIKYLDPDKVSILKSVDSAGNAQYVGQPFQRYLKIGWAWSIDERMNALANPELNPYRTMMAKVHDEVMDDIDPFIVSLKPDGFLGDTLDLPGNEGVYTPLRRFAVVLKNAVLEKLSKDPSSPLSSAQQEDLHPITGSWSRTKKGIIAELRNLNILNSVTAASQAGKRYAGMGLHHLNYLQNEGYIQSNWHDYDMANDDLKSFEDRTAHLRSIAKYTP